jgi:hypothetical protein
MLFNVVINIFTSKALHWQTTLHEHLHIIEKLPVTELQEIVSVQNYFWRLQKAHNLFLQLYPAKTFLISVRLLSHPLALPLGSPLI